jgi:hypothetical protein
VIAYATEIREGKIKSKAKERFKVKMAKIFQN